MSISQDSAATIVCREVFDETSHPSNEEVIEYAKRLGIDPDAEPHLLDLAREGLMAALPKGWSPCFHEASGAWYYYQASTGNTTWEHPLDAVYKELVAQARAGNRQMSVDEDSKTTAKDLESQEEATLPKENISSKSVLPQTKIPMKLAPLKMMKNDKIGSRKRESSLEKYPSTKSHETEIHSESSIVSDRASRDYTNLRFQDPMFYESPKLLEAMNKSFDLKEVLKRSESLSPRYEKEWEQLNSKFNSDENIIDIDRLSASSLAKAEKSAESLDKEKHPRQKELTLTGGGSIFLKSNRSRDTTPSQDGGKFEDFQLSADLGMSSSSGDRLKSILREKAYEDDDRPMEDEKKSVRFDLEKEPDIKFTYSDSDEDWESESEEQNVKISAIANIKKVASIFSVQSQNSDLPDKSSSNPSSRDLFFNPTLPKLNPLERIDKFLKKSKIVGKRFVVENVSENEHLSQIGRLNETDDDFSPRRFSNVRNIDLVSKSETDSSIASKSSLLDEIRKSKELMLESMRLSDQKLNNDKQREKNDFHFLKTKLDIEPVKDFSLEESRNLAKSIINKEHDESIQALKIEYNEKLENCKRELEENFREQKLELERNIEEKLEKLRLEMETKEEQEIQKLVNKMDETRNENLKKVKNELEVCYEKERQEILTNLKIELDQRKHELLELRNQEMEKLENDHEKYLDDEKNAKIKEQKITKQHTEKLDTLKKDFDKEFEDLKTELRLQQREKITKINEDHEKCLAEILRDFRTDEELARKLYKQRLEEIRTDFSRDLESEVKRQSDRKSSPQDNVDYEKLRCEKRLIEDKYNTLKEKYLKLKKEVRIAVERRTKRKEGNATASETEKSTSARTRTDKPESSDQKSPLKKTRSNSLTLMKSQENQSQGHSATEDSDDQKLVTGFPGSIATVGTKNMLKFESDDTTTASETNSNFLSKKKKNFTKKTTSTSRLNNNVNNENPVENIRKQLEKLEDLGDQLPSNETAYTLRYPFQDKCESSRGDTAKLTPVSASSELEFFRHRIHVERDSVRRAREALRQQRSAFQGRQKAWKQRSARATLEQLVKEERELSDMEVSLHRTRSLLGEKVIHLRHLEQSLDRVANAKKNENDATVVKNDEQTLSDMSSASSGFSSTDLGTDTFMDKPDHYQESTEIIASLENLNSEIREIWGVLNKRQDNNVPPPPTLMYSDLGWLPYQHLTSQPSNVQAFGTPNIQSNILSQLTAAHPPTANTQNIIAQYGPNSGFTTSVGTVERATSNLMERTRNLRDWLRQARVESSDLVSPGQATL